MADLPENNTPAENAQAQANQQSYESAAWMAEIKASERELEKWHKQADKIVDRFLDMRTQGDESKNKYNLFTTNTLILISTLYAKFPKPLVTREYEDESDDVARVAAIMLERCLRVKQRDHFDLAMKNVVQDRLVAGMGQVWFRYEPTIVQDQIPPVLDAFTGAELMPATTMDRLINEEVITDYVFWRDFLWSPARVWEEVRWVARRVKMNKEDAGKRFGEAVANSLNYRSGVTNSEPGESENNPVKYAIIFEIWCKRTKKVYFVSEGVSTCLDVRDDPLQLKNFWPCPKPLLALTSTRSVIPRPDYLMIQDQYTELDELNNRIVVLQRAVKVVGVYDQTSKEIGRIFNEGIENTMIGAANFSQFSEKGGFKGMCDWLPIDQIVTAIQRLREYRTDLVAQIYELSGISDIMRGATKASETLGAQELKSQYGAVRLQFIQMDVAAFVEDALGIKSDIMIKKFQPNTIRMRSNIDRTADGQPSEDGSPPLVDQALQLMKDPTFDYRIEVHADSMAVPEFNAERDARLGYIRAIAEFLTSATPIMEQNPGSAPYLLGMMQWAAAGFRVGRGIEGLLDKAIAAATKAAQTPPAPPPVNPLDIAKSKQATAAAMKTIAETKAQVLENKFIEANPSALAPPPVRPTPVK